MIGHVRTFEADVTPLSDTQRELIANDHGLTIIGGNLVGEIDEATAALARVDINFVTANPDTPAENTLSRLDNYVPRNESQEVLLTLAQRLVDFRSIGRLSGLVVCGHAGVGKTHIAVGVAKKAMLEGQSVAYVNASRAKVLGNPIQYGEKLAEASDIVILDDANQKYGSASGVFQGLVSAMHDKGSGKLLVTGNYASPEQLVEDFTTGPLLGEAGTMRLRDRAAGALLGHTVSGNSYRREKQDDQAPWWLES